MTDPYPVRVVPADASDQIESLGSKSKFWYTHAETGERWMFKAVRRVEDGDDWAERVAADVAHALGLPHAHYDLARLGNGPDAHPGVATPRVHTDAHRLVHGNEVLADYAGAYAVTDRGIRGNARYTPALVLEALGALGVGLPPDASLPPGASWPSGVEAGVDAFVGYLLLDALVVNTDRHDENWAVLDGAGPLVLAPTFDHASCLGRELPDSKRQAKLGATAPPHDVSAYLERPQARFYGPDGARLTPRAAFAQAAALRPRAARAWLARLATVPHAAIGGWLARVPPDRISPLGTAFAARTFSLNHTALLALRDALPQ